jgi:hypothetical protein
MVRRVLWELPWRTPSWVRCMAAAAARAASPLCRTQDIQGCGVMCWPWAGTRLQGVPVMYLHTCVTINSMPYEVAPQPVVCRSGEGLDCTFAKSHVHLQLVLGYC